MGTLGNDVADEWEFRFCPAEINYLCMKNRIICDDASQIGSVVELEVKIGRTKIKNQRWNQRGDQSVNLARQKFSDARQEAKTFEQVSVETFPELKGATSPPEISSPTYS
jgi:ligand-binding SRPBCC domain-containing protein